MIFVLIHWRIKTTPEAEAAFIKYWAKSAGIIEKSHLVGEFLSAPIPASELPFRVDDLSEGHSLGECRHFLNVGIWQEWASFYEQVGKLMGDNKPLLPFEAERRTRTVLEPREWRIGNALLPLTGSCD